MPCQGDILTPALLSFQTKSINKTIRIGPRFGMGEILNQTNPARQVEIDTPPYAAHNPVETDAFAGIKRVFAPLKIFNSADKPLKGGFKRFERL